MTSNGKSVTGERYLAWPMGPFPEKMETQIKDLVTKGKVRIESRQEYSGAIPTEIYSSLAPADEDLFSADEKAMMDRVTRRYGHLSGGQLETLTHAEAPYIGTKPKEEIMYELALYRGTDFSDNA